MCEKVAINNEFYDDLGEMWYHAKDHPIALLRAENKKRTPWIIKKIDTLFSSKKIEILDLACGAGFLSNELAKQGHSVTGVDLSEESLNVARKRDQTKTVQYQQADAYTLPFKDSSFDIVCSMDFLEHVEEPQKIIREISRVLKPGGIFFFHTFNRNPLSWLVILKGVEWFVKNSPKNLHLYRMFIKPQELATMCKEENLEVKEVKGLYPDFLKLDFWKMLLTRQVGDNFSFKMTSSTLTTYFGWAYKNKE